MNIYSIKKILVPVDLSESSLNALDTAVWIAKKQQASLTILNVTEKNPGNLHENGSTYTINESNQNVLNALLGGIEHVNEISPRLIHKKGNVVECITETVIAEDIDLIVMGTHGASGFRDGFIGSNTYNVIKYSSCAVLTIPRLKKYRSFTKVLFPIRPVTGALQKYAIASQLMEQDSTLQVLGLSYVKMERETAVLERIVDEIREDLEMGNIDVDTSWEKSNSIAEDILRFAQNSDSELIVITAVLDAINKAGFVGPHAQKIINCSKVPTLSIKKRAVAAFA